MLFLFCLKLWALTYHSSLLKISATLFMLREDATRGLFKKHVRLIANTRKFQCRSAMAMGLMQDAAAVHVSHPRCSHVTNCTEFNVNVETAMFQAKNWLKHLEVVSLCSSSHFRLRSWLPEHAQDRSDQDSQSHGSQIQARKATMAG